MHIAPGSKLRSPAKEQYLGPHMSQTSRPGTLAYLSRSASTQQASISKYGYHGLDKPSGDEGKGKSSKTTMLTRGASFRRQGSSGMTWADNWIFTDDGMFLGRHAKVADEKGATARSGTRPGSQEPGKGSGDYPTELQRSRSVGAEQEKHRSRWGLKWIKKNFRKAFR